MRRLRMVATTGHGRPVLPHLTSLSSLNHSSSHHCSSPSYATVKTTAKKKLHGSSSSEIKEKTQPKMVSSFAKLTQKQPQQSSSSSSNKKDDNVKKSATTKTAPSSSSFRKVEQQQVVADSDKNKKSTFKPIDSKNASVSAAFNKNFQPNSDLFERTSKMMETLKDHAIVPSENESMEEWFSKLTANDPSFEDLLSEQQLSEWKSVNYEDMKKNWREYLMRADRQQALVQISMTMDELYSRYHVDDIEILHFNEDSSYHAMLNDLRNIRKKYRDIGKRVKGILNERKLALVPITEEERIKDEKYDAAFLKDGPNFMSKAYWDRYYEQPDEQNSPEYAQWKEHMKKEHDIDIDEEENIDLEDAVRDYDEVPKSEEESFIKKRARAKLHLEESTEKTSDKDLKSSAIFKKLLAELPYEAELNEEDLEKILTPEERETLKKEYELESAGSFEDVIKEFDNNSTLYREDDIDVDTYEAVDLNSYKTIRLQELEERERATMNIRKEHRLQYPQFTRGDVLEIPSVLNYRINELVNVMPRASLRKTMEMLSTRYRLAMLSPGDEIVTENKSLKSNQWDYLKELRQSVEKNKLTEQHSQFGKGKKYPQRDRLPGTDVMLSQKDCVAYLPAFLPGHFAAISHILMELKYRLPDFWPTRWLDFGAGPGVAVWAMMNVFRSMDFDFKDKDGSKMSFKDFRESLSELYEDSESIEKSELLRDSFGVVVEPNSDMSSILETLLKKVSTKDQYDNFPTSGIQYLRFLTTPIGKTSEEKINLAVAGWSMGEVEKKGDKPFFNAISNIMDSLAPGGIAVFVEAGSPTGFRTISRIRSLIVESMRDSSVLMPCSHSMKCPLYDPTILNKYIKTLDPAVFKAKVNPEINDSPQSWCHFTQRFKRMQVMRFGERKHAVGTEKYSYLVVQKSRTEDIDPKWSAPRLVNETIKRGQHVIADMCTKEGRIQRTTIPKSIGRDAYRFARKMQWGDSWWWSTKKNSE